MGGLSTATIHLAIGLSRQFSIDEHQILVQQESNDEKLDEDYEIPNNLEIKRMPKFGLGIYPITINMLKYIKEFNYKPRLSSGYFNFKLPFIDYTECDFRPGAQARFEAGDGFFFHWNKDDKRLLLKDNIEEF